jgi:CheY-like chemotaxis protein
MARVLVAEDDLALSHIVRRILESRGNEVITADDGLRALALAQRRRPDIIVCDLLMATMDGFVFLDALSQDERTRVTPVVVLTAVMSEAAGNRCYELGAKVFMTKPFDSSMFVGIIEDVLESREPSRSA